MSAPAEKLRGRLSRVIRAISWILATAGLIAGVVSIATCARAGWSGALMGIGSFLAILALTIFFVGAVYLLTLMSDDIRALRRKIESSGNDTEKAENSAHPKA
jgi:Na+/H+-dicarboxylate symporter